MEIDVWDGPDGDPVVRHGCSAAVHVVLRSWWWRTNFE